jgi:glycosyltransferase involved in cell wall biosynthesis
MRKPCIIVAGGSDVSLKDMSPAGYSSRNFLHKIIIKWTLRHADAVLAVSKDIYEDAKKLGAKKNYLVYVCVDTKKYRPMKIKKENIILIVSHLSKQNVERKRIENSINSLPFVLKKIPDAKLVIVGTKLGGYNELKDLVKTLKIDKNVIFTGRVSEEKKIRLYNKSKVFLSPSEHEGFGLVIVEGMACGLPAIVTDRGALPEVVGRAGIYVPLNDVGAISNAIINIIQNNNLRNYLSRKSIQQANKFSFERRRNEIKKIIESL